VLLLYSLTKSNGADRNNFFWRAQNGNAGDVHKGKDYFHSSWIDLIISDLIGLNVSRPDPSGPSRLRYAPLIQQRTAPEYFALDGVRVWNAAGSHDVTLLWDENGSRYRRGVGMTMLVNGSVVASRRTIGVLEYELHA
jgi:hypothetical protein